MGGLVIASGSGFAALISVNKYAALAWLALCYGGITFQQPTVWATCVDIGRRHAGAVAGCMNTAVGRSGPASFWFFLGVVAWASSLPTRVWVLVGEPRRSAWC